MSSSSAAESYQPYVEDYDSVISEVVPLTRRQHHRGKSSLSQEMSSSYDGVSDSGYSSTNTPNNETPPPPKSATPAPTSTTPGPGGRKDALKRVSTSGIQRPSSKAYNRTSSPAVPRNIPGAKPRERSPAMPSTGGADECDCADCKKDTTSKALPSSPSALSGSYNGSYSQSPSWQGSYHYPPSSKYDDVSFDGTYGRESERKRLSIAIPPARPSSTFSGTTASSSYTVSSGYPGYYSSSPVSAPAPSSTCPPIAFSAYAPPPLNTSVGSSDPAPYSPYGLPPIPLYGSSYDHDSWDRTPVTPGSSYRDYALMPPPPPFLTGATKRHNSVKQPAAHPEGEEYSPPRRRLSRLSSDRPPSWASAPYRDCDGFDRSMSVPPSGTVATESARRKTTTPGPQPRRRESSHSQGVSGQLSSKLGPSALSRAMESCAISDEPPVRGHSRSHSDYYSHGPSSHGSSSHGQLTRRDPGAISGSYQYDEQVQMSVPDQDGETFTMRYPAGIPVKLQLNGGTHKSGPKVKKENIECSVAYRCVQQRQQEVHNQLRYGALEHGSRKPSANDYTYRPSAYGRRATMSGAGL